MKKLKFTGLIILLILSITAIACNSQDKPKPTANNNTVETNKNNTEHDNFETHVNSPKDKAIFEENEGLESISQP